MEFSGDASLWRYFVLQRHKTNKAYERSMEKTTSQNKTHLRPRFEWIKSRWSRKKRIKATSNYYDFFCCCCCSSFYFFHSVFILCKRTHKLQNNASILQINQLTFKCCWNVGVKVYLRWNMWITCRHSGYSHTFGDFIWSKATFCFAIHTHTHNIRLSNPIEFHSAWKVAEGGGPLVRQRTNGWNNKIRQGSHCKWLDLIWNQNFKHQLEGGRGHLWWTVC